MLGVSQISLRIEEAISKTASMATEELALLENSSEKINKDFFTPGNTIRRFGDQTTPVQLTHRLPSLWDIWLEMACLNWQSLNMLQKF